MGLNIANWDTTVFATETLKAFYEAGIVPDNSYLRTNSNDSKVTYGNIAAITVKNTADNAELADAGATEDGTTISADNPQKGWVYIPKSAISTHSTPVVSNYAQALGGYMRQGFDMRVANLLAKNYITQVTFNDDLTDSTLGTEVATALKDIIKNFDRGKAPSEGRFCLLEPGYFSSLWNVAGARSSDFISGADNGRPFNQLNFLGMNVRSYVGGFNVDSSADTNLDSKYRVNQTSLGSPAGIVYGVAWHRSAVAVNFYEDLMVEDGEIFDKDAILVKSRMLIGTGITRSDSGAIQILVGDQ